MLRVVIVCAFFASIATAATIDEFKNDFLTARAYLETPAYSVEIQSKTNQNAHTVWRPNLRTLTGVDVSINGFIGGGIAWANNDDPGSAQKKGVTSFTDYRLGMTLKSFHGEANFQQYQGFYIDNTNQIDPSYPAGYYIQSQDMTAGNISANATFILSPENFSYTAALGQDARQETSGGSWLLGLAASDTYFNNNSGLIPTQVRSSYGEDQNIINAQFYSLNVKGGYGYTIVFSKYWFLTFAFNFGLGVGSLPAIIDLGARDPSGNILYAMFKVYHAIVEPRYGGNASASAAC